MFGSEFTAEDFELLVDGWAPYYGPLSLQESLDVTQDALAEAQHDLAMLGEEADLWRERAEDGKALVHWGCSLLDEMVERFNLIIGELNAYPGEPIEWEFAGEALRQLSAPLLPYVQWRLGE